jgi:hypothetical protein
VKSDIFIDLDVFLCGDDNSPSPSGKVMHVADLCFGASPGGGDYRCYELEKNDDGSWNLWFSVLDEWTPAYDEWNKKLLEYEDSEEHTKEPIQPRIYTSQAHATATLGSTPREVAYEMLKACWTQELKHVETHGEFLTVDQEGILSESEIMAIKNG